MTITNKRRRGRWSALGRLAFAGECHLWQWRRRIVGLNLTVHRALRSNRRATGIRSSDRILLWRLVSRTRGLLAPEPAEL